MLGVEFSMVLIPPKPGEEWMSMALAIGSLQVFNEAVDGWGAEECYFVLVVGNEVAEMEAKGSFKVNFQDGA